MDICYIVPRERKSHHILKTFSFSKDEKAAYLADAYSQLDLNIQVYDGVA